MDNVVKVKRENGEEIRIEIILSFNVEELNKRYIAYTLNDDGKKSVVAVLISEIDSNNRIKDIPFEERELVMTAYNSAKELVMMNDNEEKKLNMMPWE